jgi:hypothetical protein
MKELMRLEESQAEQTEVLEGAPESGSQVIDLDNLQKRAEAGRKRAARIFEIFPSNNQQALKSHADPFDRAINMEDEVA